jgi:UDP-N-acetylglucosamine--N-acetylmuramyl-(pentapeptide) pyrophosphoryl-undecaprenol N-acetylglucosamine transferase
MPAVLAARVLRVPLVVVSYDLLPGRASRVAARNAVACAVAFPGSSLPRATLTGAPIRQAILDVDRVNDRESARAALGLPVDRFVVAAMGGSLGSGVLNDAIATIVRDARDDSSLAIRHAAGDRVIADAPPALDGSHGLIYQPVGYEDRMPLVYAAADVLVGRGGASTVHEVAATGTPAILVPWSGAAEDHQAQNVGWLSDTGAAIRLRESELDGLAEVLAELRANPERLAEIGRRAAERGEIHRSGALAQLVESAAIA